ncbi:hypothetical protein TorRG33x02_251200, partial [Trema orientale]
LIPTLLAPPLDYGQKISTVVEFVSSPLSVVPINFRLAAEKFGPSQTIRLGLSHRSKVFNRHLKVFDRHSTRVKQFDRSQTWSATFPASPPSLLTL